MHPSVARQQRTWRYKPLNYQRLSVAWTSTDGAQQTHPDLDLGLKRIYPFLVWPFKRFLKNGLIPTNLH